MIEDWRLEPVDWKARHALGLVKPKQHDLKCWPEQFLAIRARIKTFEMRLDDRGYRVGDSLNLREFNPTTEEYSGRTLSRMVTFIVTNGPWLADGYVCMSLAV